MKYAVIAERQAWDVLTFHVEAASHEEAETIVQFMIDINDLSSDKRAIQANQEFSPDGESSWEIMEVEEIHE